MSEYLLALGKLSLDAMTTNTGMLLPIFRCVTPLIQIWLQMKQAQVLSTNYINLLDLFLHLEQGNNLLVLNISSKNCGQDHDHHYLMYDTFESHFLYQLSFSLKGQQGNNLLVLKISKKRYGQVEFRHTTFQANSFLR